MSDHYDNWERLVGAVSRREQYRRLALSHSRTPSNSTTSQSSTPSFSSSPRQNDFQDEKPIKCRWLGAKELQIAWGNDSRYWNWTSHTHSRFPEVAELKCVWWLDIVGNIKTRFLSPETTYAAFLVFKLVEGAQGLETANAAVRFVEDEQGEHIEQEEVQPTVVYLQPVKDTNGQVAVQRTDGWMEVDMGNFSFQNGYEGEVEARLRDHTTTLKKTGLIIDGIEFRPVYSKVTFFPSEVYRNRRGRGRGVLSRFSSSMINESFAVDWEKFVMLDYQEIVSSSVYRRFFPDESDGKISYMLGARRLCIAWGDDPIHWKWSAHLDSRFSEIAELNDVWWLDIRGKIDINMLSPRAFYSAYLVFGLQEGSRGLDVGNTTITFVGDDSEEDAEERAKVVSLHPSENGNGDKAVTRDDGWIEVEMGNFFLADGDEGEVEARLFEKTTSKSGLIVEGIEFRPIFIEISNTLSLDKKAVLPNIRIQG